MNKNQAIVMELLKDQEMQKKFETCKNSEECYRLAKETAGIELSKEEFVEAVKGVKALLTNVESGQLSEEELETIAGGDFVGQMAVGGPAIIAVTAVSLAAA